MESLAEILKKLTLGNTFGDTDTSYAEDKPNTDLCTHCEGRGWVRANAPLNHPDFGKAIQLNPGHHWAYKDRGIAYAQLDQRQQAIQDYDKAIQLDPDFAFAYAVRGLSYYVIGQEQQALLDLDKAIQLDHNFARAYDARGLIHSMIGWHAEADADKAKACSLDKQYC